jgi:hypothetical protein
MQSKVPVPQLDCIVSFADVLATASSCGFFFPTSPLLRACEYMIHYIGVVGFIPDNQ